MWFSYRATTAAAACLLAFPAVAMTQVTTSSTTTSLSTLISAMPLTTTTTTVSKTMSSTSATSPSGTAPSNVPGVTHIPDVSIILSIVPARDSLSHEDSEGVPGRRDGFVDITRPLNAHTCSSASHFSLTSGQLCSHGEYLSTDRNVLYRPFAVSSHMGSITSTFSVVDGFLRWYDERFYQGRARYCREATLGQVYVAFHISKTWPAGCEEVDVKVYLESQCKDGEIVNGEPILGGRPVWTTGIMVAAETITGTELITSTRGIWGEL
ncbi:hypothetical protein F4804DRAFT_308352 [Jackrogersella minutella]|nr:hypothetical protein F4804DRAFT_308352 [Jackrogersella minutella]